MLNIENLTVLAIHQTIIQDISFDVAANEWWMLTGPNGAGKSTLIKAIVGEINHSGTVLYQGQNLSTMSGKARAQAIGVLAQHQSITYDFTVEEVVKLGRYPYLTGPFSQLGPADMAVVDRVLGQLDLNRLRKHSLLTLSGGEIQRTFLAQIFAQEPDLIILDEPTTYLDLASEQELMIYLDNWRKQGNHAIISILHDLSIAKLFGTHAILLDRGQMLASGNVNDVLSPEFLDPAYQTNVSGWMQRKAQAWSDNN